MTDVGGDCNDSSGWTYPGAEEFCDGLDNDCDGLIDEGAGLTYYLDADGDGYGTGAALVSCAPPEDSSARGDDCDDEDADTHPGTSVEWCDHIDNDCDGMVDETPADTFTWYADLDRDGWGDSRIAVTACAPWELVGNLDAWADEPGDCDDGDASAHPLGLEVMDGADNDCDGRID